ncbi:MAG: hypothetical protein RJA37_1648, partial [Verrucomicrobiota bacterium]
MSRIQTLTFGLLLAFSQPLFAADEAKPAAPTAEGLEFFEKKIRPILSEHCYECHSIAKNSSKGSLIL